MTQASHVYVDAKQTTSSISSLTDLISNTSCSSITLTFINHIFYFTEVYINKTGSSLKFRRKCLRISQDGYTFYF